MAQSKAGDEGGREADVRMFPGCPPGLWNPAGTVWRLRRLL